MPGRSYSTGTYKFGFNGKENDNEVKGSGNQQDYGMRIYDPRLGKFLSVDPLFKSYPELTSYQFASNTPIMGIDRDGEEILEINSSMYRMRFTGYATTTMTGKAFTTYDVITITSNIPQNYHGGDNPSARVGTNGKDEPLCGPFFKQSENPFPPDSPGESDKPQNIRFNERDPVYKRMIRTTGASPVLNRTNSAGDVLGIGIDMANFFAGLPTAMAINEEVEKRTAFYRATIAVDQYKIPDKMRSDLINYITDGTIPNNSVKNPSKEQMKDFDDYKNLVVETSKEIMNNSQIKVQTGQKESPKTYSVTVTDSNR